MKRCHEDSKESTEQKRKAEAMSGFVPPPHHLENFDYCCPTQAVFGTGTIGRLGKLVPEGKRVMVTYGGGSIKRNGVYDKVKAQLGERIVAEFGGIEPNPDYDTLMKAVAVLKEAKADFLLAVGGGSVVDGTKFIALAAAWTKTADPYDILREYAQKGNKEYEPHAYCPLAAIVTLPATGTEMNDGGVVSCRRLHEKTGVSHPSVYPVFSILDPETTYTLPRKQIANGLADSFVHVMEQYAGHYDMGRVQDEEAEGLLRALVDVAPDALNVEQPCYKARADYFWAATQGLNYLIACGVRQCWATHMIGHELTVFYGLDHGVTLAIVMPRLLTLLAEQRQQKLARMAERVWHIPRDGKSDLEMTTLCIARIEAFFQSLGIATTLSGNGCDASHIKEIAAKFRGRKLGAEQTISEKEVEEILTKSL